MVIITVPALDSLGFGAYKEEARAVLQETKEVAQRKRRGSTRLENLGIPEEELLRQQQELFAQVWIFCFFGFFCQCSAVDNQWSLSLRSVYYSR